jgi:hypothetical protein
VTAPYPPTPAAGFPNPQPELTSQWLLAGLSPPTAGRQGLVGLRDHAGGKAKASVELFAAKLVGRYLSGAPLKGADDATDTPQDESECRSRRVQDQRLRVLDGWDSGATRRPHPRRTRAPKSRASKKAGADGFSAGALNLGSRSILTVGPIVPFALILSFRTTGVSASSATNGRSATTHPRASPGSCRSPPTASDRALRNHPSQPGQVF